MRAVMPDFVAVTNPMDLTAQALVDPAFIAGRRSRCWHDPVSASLVFGMIQTDADDVGVLSSRAVIDCDRDAETVRSR